MSNVTFPLFSVTDGSWGPCKLAVSNVNGLAIVSKQTGQLMEKWQWPEISHVTIKNVSSLLVQAKKHNGVKKQVTFSAVSELARFENVLTNAVPILKLWNIKRQRKFLVIQPEVRSATTTKKIVITDVNSKVQSMSSIPPPPPPPPPMMVRPPVCPVPIAIEMKIARPTQVASYDSVMKELLKRFPKGPIESSEMKSDQTGEPSGSAVTSAESIKTEETKQVVICSTATTDLENNAKK